MADIEIVIKMSEEEYSNIEPFLNGKTIKGGFNLFKALEIIKNGTPLPKQHGKIIDADSIPSYRIRGVTEYCRGYNDRTTEVENAIVNAPAIIK